MSPPARRFRLALESVSPEKMKIFAALARDPNPIHWDRAAVAERGLGDRLINQGPINLGYVVNMLLAWTGPASLARHRGALHLERLRRRHRSPPAAS